MDLCKLRLKYGMKQSDLASKVGISFQAISHYEKGRRRPRPEVAKRLGQVLNIDWTEFYKADPTEQDGSGTGGRNDRNPEVAAQKDERHADA